MKRFYFLLLFLTSCVSGTLEQKPFDRYFDFDAEIVRLESQNPVVEKTITKDGQSQSITDTVNWAYELNLFKEANINKSVYRDRYEVTSEQNGNATEVTYTAKDSSLLVRRAQYTFENELCTKVVIKRLQESLVQNSVQELTYIPGSSYVISSDQSVRKAFELSFLVEGRLVDPENRWRATLDLGEAILPFNFDLTQNADQSFRICIINGQERIEVNSIEMKGDSLVVELPVFDSELRAYYDGAHLKGNWHHYSKGAGYVIPFNAEKGSSKRFLADRTPPPVNFDGKWEVLFSPDSEKPCKAIGVFEQGEDNKVTGTFITETGDYRFLEGTASDSALLLSTFDGSHAFLFKATMSSDQTLMGTFWSGNHWKEPWSATKNEQAELADPESLTTLKEGHSGLSFSFPDLDSNMVSLSDERFKNKVVIVDVMGSWCPNCMDGTVFLKNLHDTYHKEGLEVVALAYERPKTFVEARKAVLKHKESLAANFDFLIAGPANKKKASESLPMLTNIHSFPTTIFIDRQGNVRKIYTGFYGPGTGDYYTRFAESTNSFVEKLLMEGKSEYAQAKK